MKVFVLCLFFVLYGCISKPDKKIIKKEERQAKNDVPSPKITGDKYFDYDEIDHYQIQIKYEETHDLYENQTKSWRDKIRMETIVGKMPTSISDSSFIGYLESFGYSKSKVNPKKFKAIDAIFTEKKHEEVSYTLCIYIYRDILIFRKKSRIVGMAKICFQCKANVIVGTKSNTKEFGMSDDYKKLYQVLYGKLFKKVY